MMPPPLSANDWVFFNASFQGVLTRNLNCFDNYRSVELCGFLTYCCVQSDVTLFIVFLTLFTKSPPLMQTVLIPIRVSFRKLLPIDIAADIEIYRYFYFFQVYEFYIVIQGFSCG